MTTVAVTGGNGRLGQALLRYLATHDYDTVNVSRGSRRDDVSDQYIRADLTDPGDVHAALGTATPDVVVHLGMIPTPESNPGHEVFQSNAHSPYLVYEAAEAQEIRRVVTASSLCAIGAGFEPEPNDPDYLPLDESSPARPSTPYGIGKRTLEVVGAGFGRRDAAPSSIVSLRFPWITDEAAIVETFVAPDRTLEGLRDSGAIWNARQTYFTYLHVDDAVRGIRHAIEADVDGHETVFLNAADTNAETPTQVLIDECYPESEIRHEFSEFDGLVDTSKAARVLDWQPERSWRAYE